MVLPCFNPNSIQNQWGISKKTSFFLQNLGKTVKSGLLPVKCRYLHFQNESRPHIRLIWNFIQLSKTYHWFYASKKSLLYGKWKIEANCRKNHSFIEFLNPNFYLPHSTTLPKVVFWPFMTLKIVTNWFLKPTWWFGGSYKFGLKVVIVAWQLLTTFDILSS